MLPIIAASKSGFPPWAAGVPFLLLAIGLAAQTYYTYRRGYMYCGRTETVEKKRNPRAYRFWFCVQIVLVLLALALSTFGYWR